MKIFCLITEKGETGKKLVCHIDQRGHDITNLELLKMFFSDKKMKPSVYFEKTLESLSQSDILVGELSEVSAEAGYIVSYALARKNISVIALIHKKKSAGFFSGITVHQFRLRQYRTFDDIVSQLSLFGI